jgi:hypothetical protein
VADCGDHRALGSSLTRLSLLSVAFGLPGADVARGFRARQMETSGTRAPISSPEHPDPDCVVRTVGSLIVSPFEGRSPMLKQRGRGAHV